MLEIKYSSGSKSSNIFEGETRKSIGGVVTSTTVPKNLQALFGSISLSNLSKGSIDYRLVYIENNGLSAFAGTKASGKITVVNNANLDEDTISVAGVDFVAGTDFEVGNMSSDSAEAIRVALVANGTVDALMDVKVVGNIINLVSKTVGVGGNAIGLTYTDSGSGESTVLESFAGGSDAVSAEDVTQMSIYTNQPVKSPVIDPAFFGQDLFITILDNSSLAGEVVSVHESDFTFGGNVAVGGTISETITNLKNAIDADVVLAGIITTSIASDVLVLTCKSATLVPKGYVSASSLSSFMEITGVDIGGINGCTTPLSNGDSWIVPEGSVGDWLVPIEKPFDVTKNSVIGKVATFFGGEWTFSFAPFSSLEFGFVNPSDIDFGGIIITNGFITPINDVFEQPAGVEFVECNTIDNECLIGDGTLNSGARVGMWIKRVVSAFKINHFDLEENGGGLSMDEVVNIEIKYEQ